MHMDFWCSAGGLGFLEVAQGRLSEFDLLAGIPLKGGSRA